MAFFDTEEELLPGNHVRVVDPCHALVEKTRFENQDVYLISVRPRK